MTKKGLLSVLLEIGESMLSSGAEVNRVEDTLTRIAASYGAVRTDVFVITSSIVLTLTFPDEEIYTLSRRISYSGSTDFVKLEKINALSRRCCDCHVSCEELKSSLDKINADSINIFKLLVGSFISAGSFAFFFGGSWNDAVLAALLGLFVCGANILISKITSNNIVLKLLSSFAVACVICMCCNIFGWFQADKVAIGTIMLLIPGIAITNAFRDVLVGDTISGTLKAIQSILWAMMIAAGFMAAIKITSVDVTHTVVPDGLRQLPAALLGALGFAMLFNLRFKLIPIASLGGLLCWGVFILCENVFGLHVLLCSLFAGLFAELFSQIFARILKTPSTLYLIPAVIPLVPGSSLYYSSAALVTGNFSEFRQYALVSLFIILGIAFGIGISANIFTQIGRIRARKK